MKIQARSEKHGLIWYNTVKEAMEVADKDETIHTISFDVGNERVILTVTRRLGGKVAMWACGIDTNDTQDDAPSYYGSRRRAEIRFDSTGKLIP